MSLRALKALARTRSLGFARDYLDGETGAGSALASVPWWNGDGRPVYYRRGTSDVSLVYDILFKSGRRSEYWLPDGLAPRVIFDIGGNIGIAARYLAHRFPGAELHSFEPIPGNLEVMRRNLAGSPVQVHGYGMGGESGVFGFRVPPGAPRNLGAYSRYATDAGTTESVQAEVKAVPEVLGQVGVSAIDIIKIDVEGAEHDVIAAFPDQVLAGATWIYGELHGAVADPRHAFAVLERLAAWFDIEMHKRLRKQTWFFDACNRAASARFAGFRRGR